MEPLLLIVVPGILGGVLLALFLTRFPRQPDPADVGSRLDPPSPSLINMAHIRPSGLGGLGMLAMAVTVAIFVPRIRLTMLIALVLGGAMSAVLIARRRKGPLPSSSEHAGAHSPLFPDGR